MNAVPVRIYVGLEDDYEMSRRYNRSSTHAEWWETVYETHGFQRLDQ
jgi:hypothetical protein